ncbi:hypothetical protein M2451_000726 [Dysgonomonas sp. PFB1-18]|uniref:BatD family protein n=1 Tax=unclassified Dysgonomonas TaxID=2630389 RepID=UPI0024735FE9|nr:MULTISPECIES: BatD family protein [unclassified Dysgonomonas]MDH6308415.1 hypothetical protein [Dysgonomonas sp. PF1-14]MDH6337916.1 hypothetical protein [Dysgonomonas sp. PF1-16]MDH6379413.1 hypothetical protein [Dysgonomonas sp. PFB1-18]MDH6396744.1 hypothetical protein [Dysgonomonas sp. PF1-23]
MLKNGCRYTLRRLLIVPVILFPFLSVIIAQDVKVRIKAPETVMTEQQFRVDYVVESDTEVKEPVIIKKMVGFEILYGPSVSTSVSIAFKEGKRVGVYNTVSTYYLKAAKAGKHTLPRAEITYNKKKYKSESFAIEVRSADDVVDEIDAFVKTVVSRPGVNLSDTLMLTYKLYTTKEIHRIISTDFPLVNGFYSTNITRSRQVFTEETVNGKRYKVADLRKLILQPRSIGRKVIPEGQIVVEYNTPTGRKVRDMWGDVYDEAIRSEKTLKLDSAIIRVQDLKAI